MKGILKMVILTKEDAIAYIHNETLIPMEELEQMTKSELRDWIETLAN